MASSGNFCTMNQIDTGSYQTITEGNLKVGGTGSSTADQAKRGATFYVNSGKWYWEVRQTVGGSSYGEVGISVGSAGTATPLATSGFSEGLMYQSIAGTLSAVSAGYVGLGTVTTTSTGVSAVSNNQVINIALDMDNRKLWFGKDGTYFNSGDPANGTNPQFSWTTDTFVTPTSRNYATNRPSHYNFGQDSTFGGNETAGGNADDNSHGDFHSSVPTGFLALCSSNLSISDDIDPAQTDDNFPQKNFNTITYTGNGSNGNSISGVGFAPDFVWVKSRSGSNAHQMYDSNRGTGKLLSSNNTDSEQTYSSVLQSFDSDGFTAGTSGGINGSGNNLVAWCWKANGGTTVSNSQGSITATVQANQAAGFSIVTYTGNNGSWGSSNQDTYGHGLSKAPEFIITKERNNADEWTVFHAHVGNGGGSNAAANSLVLNSNAVLYTNQSYKAYGGVMPTSTLVTVEGNTTNSSGSNHVAYCWHSVDGYSKFGSYIGNGNANGPFIYTGFRPRMIFVKRSSTTGGWWVFDSARDIHNPVDQYVGWHSSGSESSGSNIDFLSNGFKLRTSDGDFNGSGTTIIYGAWGDVPFKYNNTF
jgi:hypothetical protein